MEKYGIYKKDAYEEVLSGYDAVQMVNFTNGLNRIMIESVKSADAQLAIRAFLEGIGKLFEVLIFLHCNTEILRIFIR